MSEQDMDVSDDEMSDEDYSQIHLPPGSTVYFSGVQHPTTSGSSFRPPLPPGPPPPGAYSAYRPPLPQGLPPRSRRTAYGRGQEPVYRSRLFQSQVDGGVRAPNTRPPPRWRSPSPQPELRRPPSPPPAGTTLPSLASYHIPRKTGGRGSVATQPQTSAARKESTLSRTRNSTTDCQKSVERKFLSRRTTTIRSS